MPPNSLTPEEQRLVEQLAQRQHEEETVESRLLERLTSRARTLWGICSAIVVATVVGTGYVLDIKGEQAHHTRELEDLRRDMSTTRAEVFQLRLEMKDKVNRKDL